MHQSAAWPCIVLLAAWIISAHADVQFSIQHLRVEHLHEPIGEVTLLGIDSQNPRFDWILVPHTTTDRGVAQAAYQLKLYSMADGLLWDSGKVMSNQTYIKLPTQSKSLASDTTHHWSITAWDANGGATSANASFHTGLFDASDWQGSWITPGLKHNLVRSPSLHIPSTVASASVFISGVGYFELTVNGVRVGAGRKYDVAWTAYAQRVNYVSFDLAPFLTVGQNVLGVELGNGWYQEQGWYQLPPYMGCSSAALPKNHGQGTNTCNGGGFSYSSPNQLILQANVILNSGATLHASSGPGWTSGVGPIVFDSLYDGEHHDARKEQPGWDSPGFKPAADDGWIPASIVTSGENMLANAKLSSQLYEPIRAVEEVAPVDSWIANGGSSYIFDFGRNMVGVVRLQITRPVRGQNITLQHAEVKMHLPFGKADGSLYYGSLRNAKATDVYTMKGADEGEVYEPKFTNHGFRYLEIQGLAYAPVEDDVRMIVTHNDVSSRSSFRVNQAADVLNKINQGCRNSIVGNLIGGPQSCGGRDERQFFTGDTALAAEASLLHYDLPAIYSHWLQTVADQQRSDGAIGDYGPDTIGDIRDGHSNWGTGFPTVAWMIWHHYGDTGVIERHLPQLHQYMHFLEAQYNKTSSSGLRDFWPTCICGWITLGHVPENSLMSSFGYLNGLRMMADMTEAVGDESSVVYRQRFSERRGEFHNSFFHAGNASYGHGTQDEHALALWIGAPPTAEIAGAVAATLVAQIEKLIVKTANATSPSTKPKDVDFVGGVGVRYLFEALSRNGHAATALKLAMKTTWPGYG
jgi:alpha-L-rhamnosidase